MIRPQIPAFACILLFQTFAAFADDLPPAVERKIDFVQDVQPLLKDRCWSCHAGEIASTGDSVFRMFMKSRRLPPSMNSIVK